MDFFFPEHKDIKKWFCQRIVVSQKSIKSAEREKKKGKEKNQGINKR